MQFTGFSAIHLRYLANEKKVKAKKISGRVYIQKESLKEWVESRPTRGKKKGIWNDRASALLKSQGVTK